MCWQLCVCDWGQMRCPRKQFRRGTIGRSRGGNRLVGCPYPPKNADSTLMATKCRAGKRFRLLPALLVNRIDFCDGVLQTCPRAVIKGRPHAPRALGAEHCIPPCRISSL
jgi:hypothetical protein